MENKLDVLTQDADTATARLDPSFTGENVDRVAFWELSSVTRADQV